MLIYIHVFHILKNRRLKWNYLEQKINPVFRNEFINTHRETDFGLKPSQVSLCISSPFQTPLKFPHPNKMTSKSLQYPTATDDHKQNTTQPPTIEKHN